MGGTFPDASVVAYEDLIPSMTCHEKDRHVLAAAVRAGASLLVTFNLRDFAAKSTDPYEVDVVDPDDFLLELLDLAPPVPCSTSWPDRRPRIGDTREPSPRYSTALQVRGPAIRRRGPTTWIALAPQLASSLRPSGTGSGAWRNLAT